MPVNYATPAADLLFPVAGVRLGVAEAGIRKKDRHDLTLIALDRGCTVAGVFTQNRFCAAPVQLCRSHLAGGDEIRALVINTGIANAGTGEAGRQAAQATCDAVGALLGIGAGAGAAVLDRRHPRTAAGGLHRRRPARRTGRPPAPTTGTPRRTRS